MSAGRHVVLVANTRLPSQRAQALQVVQQAAAYRRAGWDVTLFVARRRGDPEPRPAAILADYGVEDEAHPHVRWGSCFDWIERFPTRVQYAPARLQELSFARRAAATIACDYPDALVIARDIECARELVHRQHAPVALEIHRVPGGRTRQRWLLETTRRQLGVCGVIAISEGVRTDLVALGVAADLVRVEHDALDPGRFADLPSRDAARATLGLDADAPLVVYTGGLLAWKGVDVLVEAARELPDVQFLIAGGMDADVKALRGRAAGLANVRIDGFQSPRRVPLYLAAADVGAVPNRARPLISSRYTSPLKVFEAFAAGLPLVASDLPSLRELLEPGVDALLVEPESPRALAKGLRTLLADEELRARMSARGRARALECTWDARARRILDWLADVGTTVPNG